MHKYIVLLIIYLGFVYPNVAWCQTEDHLSALLDSLDQNIVQEKKIELSLRISEEYLKSDVNKSIHYAGKAETIALNSGDGLSYYKSLYVKSLAYSHMGLWDSCLIHLNRILEEEEEIGDNALLGKVYMLYGKSKVIIGDYREGLKNLNKALVFQKISEDKIGEANTYNQIALMYKRQSEYDSAVFYHIKCHKLAEQSGDSIGMMKALGNLGNIFNRLENYEKALYYFNKTREIAQLTHHKRFETLSVQSMGVLHYNMESFDSALYYFNQVLDLYLASNVTVDLALVYSNIGGVYDSMEDYDKAMEYFKKALLIQLQLNNYKGIVRVKSNIALNYARRGQYQHALLIYDTVLKLAIEYKLLSDVAHTYDNIYHTYETIGNYKKAFEYKTLFHQLQDSLINLQKQSTIAELTLKYGKEKDQAEILFLNNINLEQELEIKRKTNQRNMYTAIGIVLIVMILMFYVYARQRMIKDKIIGLKEIERLNEEQRAFAARSLVEGQEEERKRVAKELHDGIGVLLSSVKLQFTNIGEKVPEKKELFQRAESLLEKAAGDVRQISHNLMPGNLVRFGLFDALEDMFEVIDESEAMQAEFVLDGKEDRLPENHEVMIYRMVQELINNTIKHAHASHISLHIIRKDELVILNYSDNGQGFVVQELMDTGSLGLKSIESRVNFLDGKLDVRSTKGEGVNYSIRIPLNIHKN